MKRMFFNNEVKLWNNISGNDLVRSSDVKKFKRNYFDSVMSKLTELNNVCACAETGEVWDLN